jgi:hypothetical protein
MSAAMTQKAGEVVEVKVKDPILEVRRLLKRAEQLPKPEQALLLARLKALVGEE